MVPEVQTQGMLGRKGLHQSVSAGFDYAFISALVHSGRRQMQKGFINQIKTKPLRVLKIGG